MRLFAEKMGEAGVSPELILLGIAAASDFDPGSYLGNNVGLLMVRRDHLAQTGYTGPELYSLPADDQIPWIAKVIAHRIASTSTTPDDVGDLAVLLNPVPPKMDAILRQEAKRRSAEVKRTRFYAQHAALLKRVRQGKNQ